MPFVIPTLRLDLILEDISSLEAFLKAPVRLASKLGVDVPPDWPVNREVVSYVIDWLKTDPGLGGWGGYFIVHRADQRLIGDCGFKGRPDDWGEVEFGYSIIENYRGKGLATEAASALVEWAFRHPEVTAVCAETLPDGLSSQKVLEKLGMIHKGEYEHPEDGLVLKWRLNSPTI